MKKKLLLSLLLIVNYNLFSQKEHEKKFYNYFDEIIGQKNTDLSYGTLFKDKYKKIDGNHNYYEVDEFRIGQVSYRDQVFSNVLMKYDLLDDNLIIYITQGYENFPIKLHSHLVEKFKINNTDFIYNTDFGFLEALLLKKDIKLYKKYIKKKYKKLDKSFSYYKFEKEIFHLINFKNKNYVIKKVKDIFKVFPDKKKQIKRFNQKNSFIRKDNFGLFIKNLIESLNL